MNFTVEIASVPDRDEVVAEVWWGDTMVAEMRRVKGQLLIDIYPAESGAMWSFDLQSWLRALAEAQRRLELT
jgi:hypothetical protein